MKTAPLYDYMCVIISTYHIVGFFEVRKFHEFRRCWSFVKFNPSKKSTTQCRVWAFGKPIRENKIVKKPKITHSRNLSTSKETNYTVFMSLIKEQHAMHTHVYIHIIVSYLPNISLLYNTKWFYILTFLNKITKITSYVSTKFNLINNKNVWYSLSIC